MVYNSIFKANHSPSGPHGRGRLSPWGSPAWTSLCDDHKAHPSFLFLLYSWLFASYRLHHRTLHGYVGHSHSSALDSRYSNLTQTFPQCSLPDINRYMNFLILQTLPFDTFSVIVSLTAVKITSPWLFSVHEFTLVSWQVSSRSGRPGRNHQLLWLSCHTPACQPGEGQLMGVFYHTSLGTKLLIYCIKQLDLVSPIGITKYPSYCL